MVVDVDNDNHNVENEGDDEDDNEDDHDDDEGGEMSDVRLHRKWGLVTGDARAEVRAQAQVVAPLITDNELWAGHYLSKVATDINNGDPVPALAAVPLTTGDFLLNTSRLRPRWRHSELSLADTLKSDEKKEKTNKIVLIVLFSIISIRFHRVQYAM